MKRNLHFLTLLLFSIFWGCSDDFSHHFQNYEDNGRIMLSGSINQENVTRADENGFADGDIISVYIVDYEGNKPGELLDRGNRADNVKHTFDEKASQWNSSYDIYWKDKHTPVDIYGYYPAGMPEHVKSYSFSIKTDQSLVHSDGTMSNYEASDLLWGKVEAVEPTNRTIPLPMSHILSNVRVTLEEGSGFGSGEWSKLKKQILVTNTVQDAEIDLSSGEAIPSGGIGKNSIIPLSKGDEWRAIVVPQTIAAGLTMFSITIDGVPYKFTKDETYIYRSGKMSNFKIRVDKKELSGEYALTLTGESITPWENDPVSHDAVSREYTVIKSTAGGLERAIKASGINTTDLRNLKITGRLNSIDFYYMRDCLPYLQSLNLKEVRIKGFGNEPQHPQIQCLDDQIPGSAFYNYESGTGKQSLSRIILPDTLKSIGPRAFYKCSNLTGSLTIPEGVIDIAAGAFTDCTSLTGSLSLPTTLKYIGDGYMFPEGNCNLTYEEDYDYDKGVFAGCGFSSELLLPDGLELIRGYAFYNCTSLYGTLRLPEKLKHLGTCAFQKCKNLTGSLEIPQNLTQIPSYAFMGCSFDGSLLLHDGLASIGERAFEGTHFKGELNLPNSLININENVFNGCDFSGKLKLPDNLVSIGRRAFANNFRISGILEFPEGLNTIGVGAFANCRGIEGLVFPESIENIGYEDSQNEDGGAFQNCFGIGTIVCKSQIPPHINPGVFNGVPKDNFTLEVPETSVMDYRTAEGWRDFSRISEHHELVCRPNVACALSNEHKQTLIIDSEGDWEVVSKPDWCRLSQNSGKNKTEVLLTILSSNSSEKQEGDIVFRLKGKDYRHACHVSQYGYKYRENEFLLLHKAERGNNGGINVLILGDGYDAQDIASGEYLEDMNEASEYLFGIEPYNSYRSYFNVYTAFPVSTESGIGSLNTVRHTRFSTTFTGENGLTCDYDEVFEYALNSPAINKTNLDESLIILIPNTSDYGGITRMWETGAAISICPKSEYGYPYDFRGVIQHEAGGHGFGKLGDEYIYHNAFIDACKCKCCDHDDELRAAKSLGWYDNLELTGKIHKVGWSHLIFDNRYSSMVDVYEGGFMHSRGVFRSEQNSCMNNSIPYYSTISRESIVRRIKRYAGEKFNFEEFADKDKIVLQSTRSLIINQDSRAAIHSHAPEIIKGSPMKKIRNF